MHTTARRLVNGRPAAAKATGLLMGALSASAARAQVTPDVAPTLSEALGFEAPLASSFRVSSGAASLAESPRTQGRTALRLDGPHGYMTIASVPLAAAPTDIGPTLAVDLMLPVAQPNGYWYGALQMFASCPSIGIHQVYLGQIELTARALGIFSVYPFKLPSLELGKLRAAACTDFSVTMALNVPAVGTGTYFLDNVRFWALRPSESPVEFGVIRKGATVQRVVALSNDGPEEVDILDARVVPTDALTPPATFAVDPQITPCVLPAGTIELTVTFAPSAPGTFAATLAVESHSHREGSEQDTPNPTLRIPLDGGATP
jgi:hypothetical protein